MYLSTVFRLVFFSIQLKLERAVKNASHSFCACLVIECFIFLVKAMRKNITGYLPLTRITLHSKVRGIDYDSDGESVSRKRRLEEARDYVPLVYSMGYPGCELTYLSGQTRPLTGELISLEFAYFCPYV